MDTFTVWLLIFGLTAVSYLSRVTMIALLGKVQLPVGVLRALRLTVPAVFSAIVIPNVVLKNGVLNLLPFENAHVPAFLACALVAWRTRNMVATIAAGLVVLWIVQALA